MASCVAPDPPPFPPNSPADPNVHSVSKPPGLIARDETTEEVERVLASTEDQAKNAQKMEHDMQNMPGMEHGDMKGMQHGETHRDHKATQPGQEQVEDKKKLVEEMQKTSDEMKATSGRMKKAEPTKTEAVIYTCRMHPQIRSDKPGKCPICGMTLVKKEQTHEGH